MKAWQALVVGAVGVAVGGLIAYLYSRQNDLSAPVHNREEWVWTDYKGNERRIVVHREVSR